MDKTSLWFQTVGGRYPNVKSCVPPPLDWSVVLRDLSKRYDIGKLSVSLGLSRETLAYYFKDGSKEPRYSVGAALILLHRSLPAPMKTITV